MKNLILHILKIVGIILYLIGGLFILWSIYLAVQTLFRFMLIPVELDYSEFNFLWALILLILSIIIGFTLSRIGHKLIIFSKKMMIEKISEFDIEKDFVLYLRSFNADQLTSRYISFFDAWTVDSDMIPGTKTEEEELSNTFKKIGKLIAIDKPNSNEIFLGAGRIPAFEQDTWQKEVLNLMERAKLIVFRLGTTNALKWELQQAFTRIKHEKIVLLIPNNKEEDYQIRTLLSHFFDINPSVFKELEEYDIPNTTFLFFLLVFPNLTIIIVENLEKLRGKKSSQIRSRLLFLRSLLDEEENESFVDSVIYFENTIPVETKLSYEKYRTSSKRSLQSGLQIALKPLFEKMGVWAPPKISTRVYIEIVLHFLICVNFCAMPIILFIYFDFSKFVNEISIHWKLVMFTLIVFLLVVPYTLFTFFKKLGNSIDEIKRFKM